MSEAIPVRPSPPPRAPELIATAPANLWAIDRVAALTRPATGFKSMARVSNPSLSASAPPPQKGSMILGTSSPAEVAIWRCAAASSAESPLRSQRLNSAVNSSSRRRWASCAASLGYRSGRADGSSTSEANSTARATPSGLRDHHRCIVAGCPLRGTAFSSRPAAFTVSSVKATSISLRGGEPAVLWSTAAGLHPLRTPFSYAREGGSGEVRHGSRLRVGSVHRRRSGTR